MTVANFVEKYKDNCDITYSCPQGSFISTAGTYDESKDYLLEYTDEIFEPFKVVERSWGERKYSIALLLISTRISLIMRNVRSNILLKSDRIHIQ